MMSPFDMPDMGACHDQSAAGIMRGGAGMSAGSVRGVCI
jgi:hypothetical protein